MNLQYVWRSKTSLYCLLIFFLLVCPRVSELGGSGGLFADSGRPNANIGHFYAAIGTLYGPSSFRIGRHQWEVGLFNERSIGVARIFNVNKTYYGIMGMGLGLTGSSSFAVIAGVGAEFWKFWIANIRVELSSAVTHNGFGVTNLLVGVSLNL